MKLSVIEDKKFKDVKIEVRLLSKMDDNYLCKYLLSKLLSNTCLKYPTKKAGIEKIADLYGASFSMETNINGEGIILSVKSSVIDSCYINEDRDLVIEMLEYISEYLLHQKTSNRGFNELEFREAKRISRETFLRKVDKPSSYSLFKGLNAIGGSQPIGVIPAFNLDKLEKITNEELYDYYLKMLKNDRIDIIVCGNVEKEKIKKACQKYFNLNNVEATYTDYDFKPVACMDLIEEEKEIDQAYIDIFYESKIRKNDQLYYSYVIGLFTLGLTPSSLLFQEIREKHSLCYFISAVPFVFDHVLCIQTGVEEKNIEQTIKLCKLQMQRIKEGDYDSSLIETSKKIQIDALKGISDSNEAMISSKYNTIIQNDISIDEKIKAINEVSQESIKQAFSKVSFITSYVLRKGLKHGNAI